jgi:FKBP-type peptidyl-prolyl cis-trans isomerase FklB
MKKLFFTTTTFFAVLAMISFSACTSQAQQAPKANLKTVIDSLSYAYGVNMEQMGLNEYLASLEVDAGYKEDFIKGVLEAAKVDKKNKSEHAHLIGLILGQQLTSQMLATFNQQVFASDSTQTLSKDQFLAGFIAAIRDKDLLLEKTSAQAFAEAKSAEIHDEIVAKLKTKNETYLEENKKKDGVVTLPSGLQYKVITQGTGRKPQAEETVKVAYIGKTIDGKEFDNSANHGEEGTVEFPLNRVIAGWTEGIQLMPIGSKYILYVPSELGYGARGNQGIEPHATLIFEVDLIDIVKEDAAGSLK